MVFSMTSIDSRPGPTGPGAYRPFQLRPSPDRRLLRARRVTPIQN